MGEIGRRGMLQSVLVLVGCAAGPPAGARSLFAGAGSLPPATGGLLAAIADTIVPPTDTPGAAAAGVPAMFDKLVANWASAAQRTELLEAIRAIDTRADGFVALSPAARFEMLDKYDRAGVGGAGYARLKDLIVTLYYLSEAGATLELRYEHSPGAWEPSHPVTSDTRNSGGPSGF
jgi:hypothetical protein